MSNIIIITGKSASGKDYTQKYIAKHYGYAPLCIATTRPKRPNEEDGVDYFFMTEWEFKENIKNDRFIYHTTFNAILKDGAEPETWYYGLLKLDVSANSTVVVDIDHIEPIRKYYTELGHEVVTIMLDIDAETRELRAKKRQGDSFSMDEWIRRSMDEAICYSPQKVESLVDIRMVRNDDGMIDALMKLRFRA